jgi:hypothetical protein
MSLDECSTDYYVALPALRIATYQRLAGRYQMTLSEFLSHVLDRWSSAADGAAREHSEEKFFLHGQDVSCVCLFVPTSSLEGE